MDATNSNVGKGSPLEASSEAPIFVTSNQNKLREVREILGVDLASASPDVPEIQHTDFTSVATEKVLAARAALGNPDVPVFVDDSGIEIAAWNGFPGALTKWLVGSVGNAGLLRMLSAEEDRTATAVCTVVLADPDGQTHVFRGEVRGSITPQPRGDGGFGYDPVFQPDGQPLTYAEMGKEKSRDSHRTRAFLRLREYLQGEPRQKGRNSA